MCLCRRQLHTDAVVSCVILNCITSLQKNNARKVFLISGKAPIHDFIAQSLSQSAITALAGVLWEDQNLNIRGCFEAMCNGPYGVTNIQMKWNQISSQINDCRPRSKGAHAVRVLAEGLDIILLPICHTSERLNQKYACSPDCGRIMNLTNWATHQTMGSPCSRMSRSERSAGMEGGRNLGRGFTESTMP